MAYGKTKFAKGRHLNQIAYEGVGVILTPMTPPSSEDEKAVEAEVDRMIDAHFGPAEETAADGAGPAELGPGEESSPDSAPNGEDPDQTSVH